MVSRSVPLSGCKRPHSAVVQTVAFQIAIIETRAKSTELTRTPPLPPAVRLFSPAASVTERTSDMGDNLVPDRTSGAVRIGIESMEPGRVRAVFAGAKLRLIAPTAGRFSRAGKLRSSPGLSVFPCRCDHLQLDRAHSCKPWKLKTRNSCKLFSTLLNSENDILQNRGPLCIGILQRH